MISNISFSSQTSENSYSCTQHDHHDMMLNMTEQGKKTRNTNQNTNKGEQRVAYKVKCYKKNKASDFSKHKENFICNTIPHMVYSCRTSLMDALCIVLMFFILLIQYPYVCITVIRASELQQHVITNLFCNFKSTTYFVCMSTSLFLGARCQCHLVTVIFN